MTDDGNNVNDGKSKRPRPLIHKGADVRHFHFMPLDVQRLRDSRLAATATDAEFRAAILLWCAAWHQVPAGSLPDDDRELAVLSQCGRDAAAFREVRQGALHGFTKCADGRLYHEVICAKAKEALGRSEAGRKGAKSRWKNKKSGNATAQRPDSGSSASAMQGTGTGTGTDSVSKDTGREAPASDPLKDLFDTAVKILGDADVSPKHARSKLGQWRKTYDDGEIFNALVEARKNSAVEPIAYVEKTLRKRSGADKPFPGYVPLGVGG